MSQSHLKVISELFHFIYTVSQQSSRLYLTIISKTSEFISLSSHRHLKDIIESSQSHPPVLILGRCAYMKCWNKYFPQMIFGTTHYIFSLSSLRNSYYNLNGLHNPTRHPCTTRPDILNRIDRFLLLRP